MVRSPCRGPCPGCLGPPHGSPPASAPRVSAGHARRERHPPGRLPSRRQGPLRRRRGLLPCPRAGRPPRRPCRPPPARARPRPPLVTNSSEARSAADGQSCTDEVAGAAAALARVLGYAEEEDYAGRTRTRKARSSRSRSTRTEWSSRVPRRSPPVPGRPGGCTAQVQEFRAGLPGSTTSQRRGRGRCSSSPPSPCATSRPGQVVWLIRLVKFKIPRSQELTARLRDEGQKVAASQRVRPCTGTSPAPLQRVGGPHEVQALPELVLVVWLKFFAEVHDPIANLTRRIQVADEHGAVDIPVHPLPPGVVLQQVNVLPEGHVGGRIHLVPPGGGPQLIRVEYTVHAPAHTAVDLTQLEKRRGEITELIAEVCARDDAADAVIFVPHEDKAGLADTVDLAEQFLFSVHYRRVLYCGIRQGRGGVGIGEPSLRDAAPAHRSLEISSARQDGKL